MYQPWAQSFEEQLMDKEDGIKRQYAQRTMHWSHLLQATGGPEQTRITTLGTPEQGRFYYPIEKRRTKDNVEAMREAEKNLDIFWKTVDQNLRSKAGDKLDQTALRKLLSQPRILQRTPAWVQPETNKTGGEKAATDVDAIRKPLSDLYLDLRQGVESTTGRKVLHDRKSTAKAKKQGVSSHPSNGITADSAEIAPSAVPDQQPILPVDARALKVFRTLFYTPSVTATPGEVVWTDFLHAMVSTGFVPEKLYGSVWQFSPTKLDVERSIQFHEPHPAGKLPYRTARRFGRRLERAYGWFGGMFVLGEKYLENI
ncbi:hypothetical protein LTR37_018504 [Vermiconidia calcicola]|uniref:Uncharacterized protein n=1 Tax=Vermiconidia calcicola TaxID=1690605 RepID=A0ACC3MIK9_9PEZI|nr:hypothetical protein LTR37_018504 [Vermiconidia calcicola]